MKSFQQFLSESITINGDFNGTLNIGGSQPEKAHYQILLVQNES